jgi:hypothetical protein
MKAREPKPDIATALTVEHFCQMFGVSEPLYRALRRNHLGPREVRVGDVRFNAHYGLKSDIAACPKSANERTRFAGARCARSGASGTDGVTK